MQLPKNRRFIFQRHGFRGPCLFQFHIPTFNGIGLFSVDMVICTINQKNKRWGNEDIFFNLNCHSYMSTHCNYHFEGPFSTQFVFSAHLSSSKSPQLSNQHLKMSAIMQRLWDYCTEGMLKLVWYQLETNPNLDRVKYFNFFQGTCTVPWPIKQDTHKNPFFRSIISIFQCVFFC